MRKLLLLAVIALTACTAHDLTVEPTPTPEVEYDGLMRFSAASQDAEEATRGAIMDDSNLNSFAVFTAMTYDVAKENAGEADASVDFDPALHSMNWMYNAHISKESGQWLYKAPLSGITERYYKYWKSNANHSFFAVAPYNVIGNNILTEGETIDALHRAALSPGLDEVGTPTLNFAVPQNSIVNTVDMMVAMQTNVGGVDTDHVAPDFDGVVDLEFKHALSQVAFNVKLTEEAANYLAGRGDFTGSAAAYSGTKITLHGLGFIGLQQSGTLNFNVNYDPTQPESESNKMFNWTHSSAATDGVIQWTYDELAVWKDEANVFSPSNADMTLQAIPSSLDGAAGSVEHVAMMIPQKINSNVVLALAFDQVVEIAGTTGGEQVVPKDVRAFINATPETSVLDELLPGMRHTFNITLDFRNGNVAMSVDATISRWESETIDTGIDGGYFDIVDNQRSFYMEEGSTEYLPIRYETDFEMRFDLIENIGTKFDGELGFNPIAGEILYKQPAGGLAAHGYYDILHFTIFGRVFELYVFTGKTNFDDAVNGVTITSGNSVTVPYTSDYLFGSLFDYDPVTPGDQPFPYPLTALLNYRTQNGGTVDFDFVNQEATYTKPDNDNINSDVVTIYIAGVTYNIPVYWGHFSLTDAPVDSPTAYSVTMDSQSNTIEIPYDTNYQPYEIKASTDNPGKGLVTIDGVNKKIIYTSTSLELGQDVVNITVGATTYKVEVNMAYIKLADGIADPEFNLDAATAKVTVNMETNLTSLTGATFLPENPDSSNTPSALSAPVGGVSEFTLTYHRAGGDAGTNADRVIAKLANREFTYVIVY